jgi:hypothetical protein
MLISNGYKDISNRNKHYIKLILVLAIVVHGIFGGSKLFRNVTDILNINTWTGVSVHRIALRMKNHIPVPIRDQGRIATLSPIFAIEAGLPIYHELATGPFLFRIGDLLSDGERTKYIGTSQRSLGRLLESRPPAAILVGFVGDLERPFVAYAEKNNYERIEDDFGGGSLYVPKAGFKTSVE